MNRIFTFLVGQSCRSALNSWAARQRRPTEDVKIFVLHPSQNSQCNRALATDTGPRAWL
jgi:hypothetical protein